MIFPCNNRLSLSGLLFRFLILSISFLIFILFNGNVHLFDWDEINFAESAREMITTGDYLNVQINYHIFWEKPPLFIWMQALSMKLFGINEFAARFPNAVCGAVTLLFLFHIGSRIRSARLGFFWVMTYAGSFLPFLYFKSGIIDPWFNLFIFSGIWHLILYTSPLSRRHLIHPLLSGVFIGLAILTKGPAALLIFLLTVAVYRFYSRRPLRPGFTGASLFLISLLLTGGIWFILQIFSGNSQVILDFIVYQIRLLTTEDAGHGGFFLYHFVVLLFGVFPASIIALRSFRRYSGADIRERVFQQWMISLFWVVLILFTLVRTKIIHYSSLCYFPLTFLAAFFLWKVSEKEARIAGWQRFTIFFTGLLYVLAAVLLPIAGRFIPYIMEKGWIHDVMLREALQAEVHWNGLEVLPGMLLLAGLICFFITSGKSLIRGYLLLSVSVILFTFFSMLLIIPRIEMYSQNAPISFFQRVANSGVYIGTLGYKSYAHLFYGQVKPPENPYARNKKWLQYGPIDKPVYYSLKASRRDAWLRTGNKFEILYSMNGYTFVVRKPCGVRYDREKPKHMTHD
jgi:4-amino-4-deoxy-L-arabinose transferase-like glycosyltransferase